MPPRSNAQHTSKSNRRKLNDVETDAEKVDGPGSTSPSPVSEVKAPKPSQLTMQIAAQTAPPMTVPPHVSAQQSLPSPSPGTAGHSRSPIIAREPTALQSLTRTLRSYVPSSVPLSIPIPTSAPSPPAVSRPVSFGSFTQPRTGTHGRVTSDTKFDGGVFASDEDLEGMGHAPSSDGVYPSAAGSDHADEIVWSKWNTIDGRLLLLLGYHLGMQIWDCSDLRNVQEVFNIKTSHVRYASVLSCTTRKANAGDYPLLGMITTNDNEDTFAIYSLARHHIIHSFTISGLYHFESSEQHIVLSSVNPPTIHILASSNLTTLHIIPSSQLSLFAPKKYSQPEYQHSVFVDRPHPVFSLHRRLLAYVSSQSPQSICHIPGSTLPAQSSPFNASVSPDSSNAGFAPSNPRFSIPFTQAELGNAAYKVGGTVFSGMMTLGGMAFSAASKAGEQVRARANSAVTDSAPPGSFHARSAPSATYSEDWRRSSPFGSSASPPSIMPQHKARLSPDASCIVILDLSNLDDITTPTPLTHCPVTKHQGVQALKFTADGTSLIVSPQDGQILRLFRLQPSRLLQGSDQYDSGADLKQLYNLHRGRTSASIEEVHSTHDGRWVGAATGNRTIHVFPSNPYGGKPDIRSHLESKVMNTIQLRPSVTDIYPVARIRLYKTPTPERMYAPISFTFLKPGGSFLPSHLLPPVITSSPYLRPAGSDEAGSLPEPISPRYRGRPRNYQDLLVFDPVEGSLSLRRISVDLKAADGTYSSGSSHNSTSTNTASRLSPSPRVSVLSQMMEPSSDLSGRESTIATWPLARYRDWGEVKEPCSRSSMDSPLTVQGHPTSNRWLAEAELTTCSPSLRVLPRSVYLKHQFFFYTLGEDYHALIRQYRLGTSGEKLDVRREVEISAEGSAGGSAFAEGFQESRNMAMPRSFDEPLASALKAELDHSQVPSVLPMLPNGPGSAKPMSFRNAIPIRSVAAGFSDGMSEGLGRIRREMHRARSPRSPTFISPRTHDSVPLEFDELDEDFVLDNGTPAVRPNDTDGPAKEDAAQFPRPQSLSKDSTPEEPPLTPSAADAWDCWDSADKKIIDDAERFDDITVVGFLEEEQEELMQAQKERELESIREVTRSTKAGRKKGRGNKKS